MPDGADSSKKGLLYRICRFLVPRWLHDCQPDETHFHRRRFTDSYRRKRSMVLNIWLIWGILSLFYSEPPFIVMMGLIATFSSFLLLDESA